MRQFDCALVALVLLAPQMASAQSNADAGKTVYAQAELAAYRATTAEDLIRRIPGAASVLDSGSPNGGGGGQGQRGFGSAGAQVLIDGRRVTGKSNDVAAALRRIDASQVRQIELIRDASDGLDVASQGVVVNLLLIAGASQKSGKGIVEVNARFNDQGRLAFDGLISYGGSAGNLDYLASVERNVWAPLTVGPNRYSNRFRDERYFYPNGTVRELRPQDWRREVDKMGYTVNLTWTPDAVSQVRLNGFYETLKFTELAVTPLTRFDTLGAVSLRAVETQVRQTDTRKNTEIGGDYERKIGKGDFKLLFIVSRRDQPTLDARERLAGTVLTQLSRSDIRQRTGEDIVRISYGFPAFGQRLELGGEAARNTLRQNTQLFGDTNGDGRVDPIFLPEADARVQELRGEAFVKLNGKLGGGFSHETSLTVEASRITSSYVLFPPRSYVFLKPRFDLRYDATARTQLGFRVERKVGQLDFNNFVPTYDGLSDRLLAGNPGIAPESSWGVELRAEHRFAKDRGTIEGRAFYELTSDEIDKTIIGLDSAGNIISASGNVGKSRAYGVEGKFSLRLDQIGLKGAIFSGRAKRQFSQVRDPFTGLNRLSRGKGPFELDLSFRQDLAGSGLSYGLDYRDFGGNFVFSDSFAVDLFNAGPRLDLFIQKKLGRFTVRLDAYQINKAKEYRRRTLFVDNQTIGTVLRRETFTETRDRRFALKVRTSF